MNNAKTPGAIWSAIVLVLMVLGSLADTYLLGGQFAAWLNANVPAILNGVGAVIAALATVLTAGKLAWEQRPEALGGKSVNWTQTPPVTTQGPDDMPGTRSASYTGKREPSFWRRIK